MNKMIKKLLTKIRLWAFKRLATDKYKSLPKSKQIMFMEMYRQRHQGSTFEEVVINYLKKEGILKTIKQ